MKMLCTVIGKREWSKINEVTGEELHCFFYAAFDEKNKPFEFKSNRDDITVHETLKFDKALAEEINLKAQFDSFKGRLKFVEIEE